MRNKIFMLGVLALILASTALAYTPTQRINFQNCSDPQRLERMLNDQFAALRDDVSATYFSGTGNFFYVDSATGLAGYAGTSWEWPKATLDSAVALCTANNGDVIFVASGHTENLSEATGTGATQAAVDLDVAGITVIGLGTDADRPTFSYTVAAGEIVIGAANVSVYNLRFIPAVTAVLTAIDIEAAGDNCLIQGCEFLASSTGTIEFVNTITLASASNDVHIKNCRFNAGGDAAGSAILATAGIVDGLVIQSNYFYGSWDNGVILSDKADTRALVDSNYVYQSKTGKQAILFSGAALGILSNNYMYSDAIATVLDPGSLECFNNWATIGIDTDAQPIPITATTTGITSNRDGSILQRLEFLCKYFETGTPGALVAPANTMSLLDILGTDGTTATGAVAGSILGAIGTNEVIANTPFTSATVASDADGSVLERLEYIQAMGTPAYNRNAPNYISNTCDMTTGTGWETVAAHEVFTVVGTVRMRIMICCTATVTDAADASRGQVGWAGVTDNIIAVDAWATAGAAQLDAGDLWIDATPAETYTTLALGVFDRVVTDIDFGYEVSGAAATAGTLVFHCWWEPISSTGAVTVTTVGTAL